MVAGDDDDFDRRDRIVIAALRNSNIIGVVLLVVDDFARRTIEISING